MRKILIIIFLIFAVSVSLFPQDSMLENQDALMKAEQCLSHTYNFSFSDAKRFQQQLAGDFPDHPAPDFLKALIIYWEYFPLLPEDESSGLFIDLMDLVVEKAEALSEQDSLYIEGLFFDLFGRAFKAMFWADNGKPGKVIPDLGKLYTYTKQGFDYLDEFIEFYFSTGLYNYYIEAYPEAHPVYKPIVAFMREGDKSLGLNQLDYAIENCVFLKVEAMMFMSFIQLKYELNLDAASEYAERLHNSYPGNIYYRNHYIIVLLHKKEFDVVRKLLSEMKYNEDSFSILTKCMADAFIIEHLTEKLNTAREKYVKCLEIADSFGPFGDLYKAIAYMGLSRISGAEDDEKMKKQNFKMAKDLTNYTFILSETEVGPR